MSTHIIDSLESQLNVVPDSQELLKILEKLKRQKLNVMFVGATGVGKSSTINSIFNMDVAKVGDRVDPETSTIQKFELDNITLWDTPGLGDSPENDRRYAGEIAYALKERDENGDLLIDEVVVLIDGSNRDMGTAYEVIENIIAPLIGDPKRIVIAINQCDMAMKGRGWNHGLNLPEPSLVNFLDEKVRSVKARITESTGIETEPIYYSALYHYNISKLLLTMLCSLPEGKRFLLADSMNKESGIWKRNDDHKNYNQEIQKTMTGSLTKAVEGAAKGAVAGATVGGLIPVIGPVVGAAVGAALGFLGGLLD